MDAEHFFHHVSKLYRLKCSTLFFFFKVYWNAVSYIFQIITQHFATESFKSPSLPGVQPSLCSYAVYLQKNVSRWCSFEIWGTWKALLSSQWTAYLSQGPLFLIRSRGRCGRRSAGHQVATWWMRFGCVYRPNSVTRRWWPMGSRERGKITVTMFYLIGCMDSRGNVSRSERSLSNTHFENFKHIYSLRLFVCFF